ncbi:hypothetical protein E4T42_02265 [Aureobasidium subglaciale]|nr:hypothetical protein E4T42_02265 [Aureobasidium subglaciale]
MSGSGSGSGPLQPTWHGFIQNSMDGLVLFEACLSGKLHHVPRRPHDRERASLIKSGSVFIYEENASGIKRWTDGVAWSPSRILGNFLIYRELEKPFPPGEKKRAMKRKRSSQEPEGRRDSEENEVAEYNRLPPTPPSPANQPDSKAAAAGTTDSDKEVERQLIGSLVDSYGFRPNGLVKKTMSISLNGVSHHLVSYYTVEDVKQRKLQRPLVDTRLNGIAIRPELYLKQNFRAPVEESDQFAVDHSGHAYPHMGGYPNMVAPSGYMMRQSYAAPPGYPMYGAAPVSTGAGVCPNSSNIDQFIPSNAADAIAIPVTNENPCSELWPPKQYGHFVHSSGNAIAIPTDANGYSISVPAFQLWCPDELSPKCFTSTAKPEIAANRPTTTIDECLPPTLQSSHMSSYRQYSSQSTGSQGEMPSIGMASGYGSSHAQPSSGSYGAPSYGPPGGLSAPQSYRHASDAPPPVQSAQYYSDGKPAVSSYT